ncbi:hypothetical protein [Actinacidiphila oryziradicis]|uniref:hypothetical protein n=1 Tax=Actinacidiphila oryziradicis TaxID=2571141 RepID=UPI001FEC8238|nr:hypothetical protein [Actinacidiphila oryziradicis]
MSTYQQRRVRVPRAASASPARPVDRVKVGRSAVRRRARGMTQDQAAAALEEARFDARQDSRHEDLADDGGRGKAELAEWERIVQLLADTGGLYDPDADAVVQEELAAEAEQQAAEQAARERELQEQEAAAAAVQAARRAAEEAPEILRRALARPGALDVFSGDDEAVVTRVAAADPAAALTVARWLDMAFEAGQARPEGGAA